jgi:cytochrome P450/NADPH-cytochrome P450 reductase
MQVQDWLAERQSSEALIDLGQGNAESDQLKDWREWRAEMLCRVIKHYSLPLEASKDAANGFFTKVGDYSSLDVKLTDCPPEAKEAASLQQGIVTASRELQNTAKSGRSTLDVCIELPKDHKTQSKEGDHLLIHPRNSDEIIDRVLACIQMSRDCAETKTCSLSGKARAGSAAEKLLLEKKTPPIVDVLAEHLDLLSAPSQDFLSEASSLAKVTGDDKLSLQLEEASRGTTKHGVLTNLAVLEQLNRCDLTWVLNNCPAPPPRRYSIANSTSIVDSDDDSANKTKAQVRLLVSVVKEEGLLGQVSGHVIAASEVGASVRCSVDAAPFGQRVADGDWSKPTVMIATGTGLAPFLSFLEKKRKDDLCQERVAADSHLILGCRSDYDELCKEELDQYVSQGTLTGLHVAHSRTTQGKRQYVSDVLREKADLFASLWEQGAIFYVCGRASSIQEALDQVARSSDKLVNEDSSTLTSQGRLIEDVWM